MQEPIELKDNVALYLIQILREYKTMKNCIEGHWHLKEILRASDDVVDDLLKKLGLCYGQMAPFKLYIHPSKQYSDEAILEYVRAYEDHEEVLWTE